MRKNIMFGLFSGGKREADKVREETRKAFEAVKNDVENVGKWIKHLHGKDGEHYERINSFENKIEAMDNEISILKALVNQMQEDFASELFKQPSTPVYRQRTVQAVEEPVQMPVQTGEIYRNDNGMFNGSLNPLTQLTSMERAVVYVLLNSDLKLSYEDIATILGKDRSTIRSQINTIRQKCVGLIEEHVEKNGKKRVFICEGVKQKVVKKAKMRGVKRTSSYEENSDLIKENE
jgi:hypothetical protein